MTPEERAESLADKLQGMHKYENGLKVSANLIAAEIRAAVEEARGKELMVPCYCVGGKAHFLYICDGCKGSRFTLTDVDEIKAAAYEDAAKILQTFLTYGELSLDALSQIVLAIRARAAEVGK